MLLRETKIHKLIISFNVDPKEFHDTKWLTVDEAEKIVTDLPNRKALETIRKKYE